jgi:hypothetical protein
MFHVSYFSICNNDYRKVHFLSLNNKQKRKSMKPNVDQVRPNGYNSNKLDRGTLDNVSS